VRGKGKGLQAHVKEEVVALEVLLRWRQLPVPVVVDIDGGQIVRARQLRQRPVLRKTPLFFRVCFPYVCPEPVLVK
jgi:hypothetical protein